MPEVPWEDQMNGACGGILTPGVGRFRFACRLIVTCSLAEREKKRDGFY
jgi:hypothetical protein